MVSLLSNKHILLGVTGSIAAYKSPELVRRLREAGAVVRVAMTENAKRFITPLTLQAVSQHPVHDNLFDLQAEAAMGHIELARWADAIVIAPASADCLARLAHGHASDLLTAVCLASKAVVAVAPAMNQGMWQHDSTQANLVLLQQKGIHILGPDSGSQACGDIGLGRMLEPVSLLDDISGLFANGLLAGQRVLLTAGPTQEPLDPVRYLSNHSSGKMGYAMAQAAVDAGAQVTIISGPVHLQTPAGAEKVPVTTAQEMHAAVMDRVADCDIFIAVAAVSDYRAANIASQKIPKSQATLNLTLERNPDIILDVGMLKTKPFIVGFAAETEHVTAHAEAKRERKHMDLIVANQVGAGMGMGADDNAVTLIGEGYSESFPCMSKHRLARELMIKIAESYYKQKEYYHD
jgi:phosphopantothenoylcysteine decarboxylase/phosphopantothenate--cysteine ligase